MIRTLFDEALSCLKGGRLKEDLKSLLLASRIISESIETATIAVFGSAATSNEDPRDLDLLIIEDKITSPHWRCVESRRPVEIWRVRPDEDKHLLDSFRHYPYTWVWEAGKLTGSKEVWDPRKRLAGFRARLENPPLELRAFVLTFAIGSLAVLREKSRGAEPMLDALRSYVSARAILTSDYPGAMPLWPGVDSAESLIEQARCLIQCHGQGILSFLAQDTAREWCVYPANWHGHRCLELWFPELRQ